jgi:hypothetical protein
MKKVESMVVGFIDFWGEVYDVNPASAILVMVILLPLILISIPVDLIRVILSKLKVKE